MLQPRTVSGLPLQTDVHSLDSRIFRLRWIGSPSALSQSWIGFSEDDGKQTTGGANIRRQSRIICERVEARLHRYLPEAAASLQVGAKHCGHVSSPFVSIRLPRRSPWRAVVRRLPDEGGLAKAGVHLSRRLLAKTFGVASREGGFVISQKIVKKVLTFFGVPE